MPKASSATVTWKGMGCRRTFRKASSGPGGRPRRDLPRLKTPSACVTPKARACPRITCKWFNLATAKGDQRADDARVNLASAERYLTPEQVAEGQRLASEFRPHKVSAAEEILSPPAKAGSPPSSGGTNPVPHPASVSGEASKIGVVNVKAEDDSYEIFVDSAFVGNTPAMVKLAEGAHVVEVKKAGFKDYRKQIQITEGSELTLRAVLEKQ